MHNIPVALVHLWQQARVDNLFVMFFTWEHSFDINNVP